MTRPKNLDLLPLLEREIRKVLRDTKATRAEKLKAIEAGSRVVMTKHKISEATDGAAGAFFAREPTAGSGPDGAVRRPAAEPAAAAAAAASINGAAGRAAPTGAGGPEDASGTDPPADAD